MKIFAAVMILISSVLTAYTIVQNEKKHSNTLSETIAFMTTVKNRAAFYSEPFKDIIEFIVGQNEYIKLKFLSDFLSVENLSPIEAWCNVIRQADVFLTDNEKEILISFGKDLCLCSREQINELSEKAIAEMNRLNQSLNENKEKKIKVTSALSVSVGLAVILIFI